MGVILPRADLRMSERRKAALRTKLFTELRAQYLADGYAVDEANAVALANVRLLKLL
jgi:hypothetical protein